MKYEEPNMDVILLNLIPVICSSTGLVDNDDNKNEGDTKWEPWDD